MKKPKRSKHIVKLIHALIDAEVRARLSGGAGQDHVWAAVADLEEALEPVIRGAELADTTLAR